MARKSTIRLLLVNDSENASEQLVSLFRNAGRVARATRIDSSESLFQALNSSDSKAAQWDLLIANDKHPELSPEACLEQRKTCQSSIPVIVLREAAGDAATLFAAGASDVIDPKDELRLCHAAFREIKYYQQQLQLASVKQELTAAEQRCEQLLNDSSEAIAYVADGMLINANQHFAAAFGYQEVDDLDCLPIIDMIDDSDQEKFKALLKAQVNSETDTHFSFTGRQEDGSSFNSQLSLSNALYDSEPCLQITLGQTNSQSSLLATDAANSASEGFISQSQFLQELDSQIKQSISSSTDSSVLFISIDQYSKLRQQLGLANSRAIALDIAELIQQQTEQKFGITHYCDDSFTLLLTDTKQAEALEIAENICRAVERQILDCEGQSIQCTLSIGLFNLDGQIDSAQHIIDGIFRSTEELREEAANNGIGNGIKIYTPEKIRKSLGDVQDDADLDQLLAEAIEDERFKLQFQPIVSLRGSSGDHYEVSLFIYNEAEQWVSANEFIKQLNFSEVNTRLDRWILLEATKLLSVQRDKGQDIRLIINISVQTFKDDSLLPWLSVALKAGGIPPEAIILQFSERSIADNLSPAIKFIKNVNDSGYPVSILDFGDSDSPTKQLSNISPKFLRLHQRYSEALTKGDSTEIKELLASIEGKNLKTIAPEIKNASALALLWQVGVDFIQGDYLASPGDEMNHEFTDIA